MAKGFQSKDCNRPKRLRVCSLCVKIVMMGSPSLGYGLLLFIVAMASLLLPCSPHSFHGDGTILVSSNQRPHYCFDVFQLLLSSAASAAAESRLTDGSSVNFNGHFLSPSERDVFFRLLASESGQNGNRIVPSGDVLAYVSERDGIAQIYFNVFGGEIRPGDRRGSQPELEKKVTLKLPVRVEDEREVVGFQDRPSVSRGRAIYVGMRRNSAPRKSWTAIYSTDLSTGETKCLTPPDVADLSPSVSPSGEWVIVASDQGKGFQGELCNTNSGLYIMRSKDGSERRLLVKDGGWPSWGANDSQFFFHRKADDGWWSIYQGTIPRVRVDPVIVERITDKGFHAFTPAASRTGEWIAVSTRRLQSKYRQIEILLLSSKKWMNLTSHQAHHYNPFVSWDSSKVGYHRCSSRSTSCRSKLHTNSCRSNIIQQVTSHNLQLGSRQKLHSTDSGSLEFLRSPLPGISLLRINGDFASISPDGQLVAFNPNVNKGSEGVYIMHINGSSKCQILKHTTGISFAFSWDPIRAGVLYSSLGGIFLVENATVHIISIFFNSTNVKQISAFEGSSYKVLTKEGTHNNAFPSPSPDGKQLVFRSSRSGHHNLYVMDATEGEVGNGGMPARRLTEGAWTDTMCSWSPDGKWIVFASDREDPGGLNFDLFIISPDGMELHKVTDGKATYLHPQFSPDSHSLVFATDFGGLSAEPISMPNQYQPYGEVFVSDLHGSHIERLTFSPYETSLPTWGHPFLRTPSDHDDGGAKNGNICGTNVHGHDDCHNDDEQHGHTHDGEQSFDHAHIDKASCCDFDDNLWLRSHHDNFCIPSKIVGKHTPNTPT